MSNSRSPQLLGCLAASLSLFTPTLSANAQAQEVPEAAQGAHAEAEAEAQGPEAAAPKPDPQAEALRKLGCAATASLEHAGLLYAVCGEDSAWVLAPREGEAPGVRAVHQLRGESHSLFVQADKVWVASTQQSAQPLAELPLAPVTSSITLEAKPVTSGPVLPALPTEGVVLEVKDGVATISLGSAHGLRLGDGVEIHAFEEPAQPEDPLASSTPTRGTVWVGQVSALSENRSRVTLSFGADLEPGMMVRKSSLRFSARRMAPERFPGLVIVEGSVRPFLPTRNRGFAAQGDVAVTYLFDIDAYLRAELRPAGFMVSKSPETPTYAAAYVSAGYDQTYLGIGLGVGALYMRDAQVNADYYYDANYNAHRLPSDNGTWFSVQQSVRLGARDGMHATLSTALRLESERWRFAWVAADVQVPIGPRSWVSVRGSGSGEPGFFFAEAGFRRLVRGNGGAGSLFLRPAAGVAGIAEPSENDYSVGPMVALHVEARLAL